MLRQLLCAVYCTTSQGGAKATQTTEGCAESPLDLARAGAGAEEAGSEVVVRRWEVTAS